MTKHTPGPWRVIPPYSGGRYAVQRGTEGGFVIKGTSTENEEADARLIAAAPTMYEYIASSASAGCATAQKIMEQINGAS